MHNDALTAPDNLIASLLEPATMDRFHKVTAVLERFVAAAPRPVGIDGIVRELEIKPEEANSICLLLHDVGVLSQGTEPEQWMLAKDQNEVTLEDVWHSMSASAQVTRPSDCTSSPPLKVELLVSQAFMELHQGISHLLRQFQLDRVRVSESGSVAAFVQHKRRRSEKHVVNS